MAKNLGNIDCWRERAPWPNKPTEAYLSFNQRMPKYLDAETSPDIRPIEEMPRVLAILALDHRELTKRRHVAVQ